MDLLRCLMKATDLVERDDVNYRETEKAGELVSLPDLLRSCSKRKTSCNLFRGAGSVFNTILRL